MSLRQNTQLFDCRRDVTYRTKLGAKRDSAEDRGAKAHRITVHFRKFQEGGRVTAMDNSGFLPRSANLLYNAHKYREFLLCQFVVTERTVKMRKDAADCQMLFFTVQRYDLIGLLRQKAIASHSGINFQMHLRNIRTLRRNLIDQRSNLFGTDRQNHFQIQQTVDFLSVCNGAEHQNLILRKAVIAQNFRFPKLCHAEMMDILLCQYLRKRQNAEAIAIALNDRPDRDAVCFCL